MATIRRMRSLQFKKGRTTVTKTNWNVGRTSVTGISDQSRDISIVGRQETVDEGSSNWYKNLPFIRSIYHKGKHSNEYTEQLYQTYRKMDLGTEFSTTSNRYVENAGNVLSKGRDLLPSKHYTSSNKSGLSDYYMEGELFAHAYSVAANDALWPSLTVTDNLTLWGMGATAISRVLPTNPVSDAAVFAGELRNDGLPLVPAVHSLKERIGFFKSLGDEYLNVQFGWKPFLSDLSKFAYAAHHGHAILRQYERDSGKGVRRKYAFPTLDTTTVTNLPNGYPIPTLEVAMYQYNASRDGAKTRTRREITDTWFSGCFTYYLNMGDSARDRMERHAQEAKKLFGIRITPEVLWNLAPWSWAADWFANTGDVIHNISAFQQDGLVMRYGYIMQHKVIADTYELSPFYFANGTKFKPTTQTFITESKVRKKASPYGFGLSFSGFTPGQLGIIGALGLSKSFR